MCTTISVGIHLLKNEQRLGSEEVKHKGGGVGGEREKGLLIRGREGGIGNVW